MIIEVSPVPQAKTEAKKNPAMLLMLVIGTFLVMASLSFCYIAQSSPSKRSLLEVSQPEKENLRAEDRNLASRNYDNYGDDNRDTYYDNPYAYDDYYGNDDGYGSSSGKSSTNRNTHRHSKKKGNKANNGNVASPGASTTTGATNNVPTTSSSSTTTVKPSTGATTATQPTTTTTQPTNTGTSTNTNNNNNSGKPASTAGSTSTTTPSTNGATTTTTTTATTTIPGTSNPNVLTYTSNEKCSNGNTAYLSGLTADQKAVILAAHNTYRSLVALGNASGQPGATDMLEMVWDDDLAAKAQTWADSCTFDHDSDSSRKTAKFPAVGQNIDIYMDSSKIKQMDFTTFVKDWYDEISLFNGAAPTNSYRDVSGTGHYTQLVWAKSYALGCGFKAYKDNGMYSYQLTCNYGTAGNWIGEKIYTKGTFNAANCKNGASSAYQGLCKN